MEVVQKVAKIFQIAKSTKLADNIKNKLHKTN